MNVIELQNVSKSFGKGENLTVVLNNVSLTIASGEFVAIMGPSGSGKSTLMNLIGLLDTPTSGQYLLGGQATGRRKDSQLAKLRRDKIGFIFQSFNLMPRLSVLQNVEVPMIYAGLSVRARRRRALELLRLVGLSERAKYRPNQISGGQAQRVAIARALANRPSLLLADEPTGNLDSLSSQSVLDELQRLHQQGTTIVAVTHNPEVAEYADRTIHLRDGRIVTANRPTPPPAPTKPGNSDKTSRPAAHAKVINLRELQL